MSKGVLTIFRKTENPKAEDAPGSRLARVLHAPPVRRAPPPAPVLIETRAPPANLPRAKLVFGFDATSSRQDAWNTSTALTDAVLAALPGQLDVALAVHGGNRVHTFTSFTSDAGKLRDIAAGVTCKAGETRLLDILARVLNTGGVGTVVYVGDMLEESHRQARNVAVALAARGTRLIILHDTVAGDLSAADIFAAMAHHTGGAVLPFDASALPKLREMLAAVAVLAVGGTDLLKAKQETMPAARLLLQHLKK
jgi:hypothetical protein